MADKKPPIREYSPDEYFYPPWLLHLLFFIFGLLLLGAVLAMIYTDYHRPWKRYQRAQLAEEQAQLQKKESEQFHTQAYQKRLRELDQELRQAEQNLHQHHAGIARLEAQLDQLKIKQYRNNLKGVTAKSNWSSLLWKYQQAKNVSKNTQKADAYWEQMTGYKKLMDSANQTDQKLSHDIDDLTQRRQQFFEEVQTIEKKKQAALAEQTQVRGQLAEVQQNFQNAFRNWPIVNFIDPTIDIRHVFLPHLKMDYFFSQTPRDDRCLTCHVNVATPGFEKADEPFRTHPRLDLYVGSESPHALNKFGCTICHGGLDRGTTFLTAAHSPHDEVQAQAWEKTYHWEPSEHWDYPMIPLPYIESSCLKCHTQQVDVSFAPQLNEGKHLVERLGCFDCHQMQGIEGMEPLRKVGPALTRIKNKMGSNAQHVLDWLFQWIAYPQHFNPYTKMPQIFHLENAVDRPGFTDVENAMIKGITVYLFQTADTPALDPLPQSVHIEKDPEKVVSDIPDPATPKGQVFEQTQEGKGLVAEGKELFLRKGCIACHTIGASFTEDQHIPLVSPRRFGPDLSYTGNKLDWTWLYNWIKNPSRLFPQTRMPTLRLDDDDIFKISYYLMSLRKSDFHPQQPFVDPQRVTQLVTESLEANHYVGDVQKHFDDILTDEIWGILLRQVTDRLTQEYESILGSKLNGLLTLTKNIPRLADEAALTDYLQNHWKPSLDSLLDAPMYRARVPEIYALVQQQLKGLLGKLQSSDFKNPDAKALFYLGDSAIARQGCFACHRIAGFEEMNPIGADLTGGNAIGSKNLEFFDFGFLPISHTRDSWLTQKLKDPRSFDQGEYKEFKDLLRMPDFHLKNEEVQSLVTFLMGLVNDPLPSSVRRSLTSREATLEKGKRLIYDKNCLACHKFSPETITFQPDHSSTLYPIQADIRSHKPDFLNVVLRENIPSLGLSLGETTLLGEGRYARLKGKIIAVQPAFGGTIWEDLVKIERHYGNKDAESSTPPDLFLEGKKVRPHWLFDFLFHPSMIRPFLNIVMPTFPWTAQDLNTLVAFFNDQNHMDFPFSFYPEYQEGYLDRKLKTDPDYLKKASSLTTAGVLGCYKCHLLDGRPPAGPREMWTPDLAKVRDRLRPTWIESWLHNPSLLQPGTKMPTPAYESDKAQALYPQGQEAMIQALKDYLLFGLHPSATPSSEPANDKDKESNDSK